MTILEGSHLQAFHILGCEVSGLTVESFAKVCAFSRPAESATHLCFTFSIEKNVLRSHISNLTSIFTFNFLLGGT
jgi:hypothetical protein